MLSARLKNQAETKLRKNALNGAAENLFRLAKFLADELLKLSPIEPTANADNERLKRLQEILVLFHRSANFDLVGACAHDSHNLVLHMCSPWILHTAEIPQQLMETHYSIKKLVEFLLMTSIKLGDLDSKRMWVFWLASEEANSESIAKAFDIIKECAELGMVDAQYTLAFMIIKAHELDYSVEAARKICAAEMTLDNQPVFPALKLLCHKNILDKMKNYNNADGKDYVTKLLASCTQEKAMISSILISTQTASKIEAFTKELTEKSTLLGKPKVEIQDKNKLSAGSEKKSDTNAIFKAIDAIPVLTSDKALVQTHQVKENKVESSNDLSIVAELVAELIEIGPNQFVRWFAG